MKKIYFLQSLLILNLFIISCSDEREDKLHDLVSIEQLKDSNQTFKFNFSSDTSSFKFNHLRIILKVNEHSLFDEFSFSEFNDLKTTNIIDSIISLNDDNQESSSKKSINFSVSKNKSIFLTEDDQEYLLCVIPLDINKKPIYLEDDNVIHKDFQIKGVGKYKNLVLRNDILLVRDNELCSIFNKNELQADDKFKGRIIEVTGRIDDFGKHQSNGKIFFVLHGGNGSGVQCEVDNEFLEIADHKALYLNKKLGDKITIRGVCIGFAGEITELEKNLGKTRGDNIFINDCAVIR